MTVSESADGRKTDSCECLAGEGAAKILKKQA